MFPRDHFFVTNAKLNGGDDLNDRIRIKMREFISIGHWNSLHLKVSQGGARGARIIFFQLDWEKHDKCMSVIISISMVSFINFEVRFVTLFKDKVSKNAPKPEIV